MNKISFRPNVKKKKLKLESNSELFNFVEKKNLMAADNEFSEIGGGFRE